MREKLEKDEAAAVSGRSEEAEARGRLQELCQLPTAATSHTLLPIVAAPIPMHGSEATTWLGHNPDWF